MIKRYLPRITRVVAAALSLMSSFPAFAGGSAINVTVTQLHIRRSIGDQVSVALSSAQQGKPACATGFPWHFTFSLNTQAGRSIYGMLLAAKASGAAVNVDGTGLCNEYGNIETLDGVVLVP